MIDAEQRTAIAEACGWRDLPDGYHEVTRAAGYRLRPDCDDVAMVPDYLNDLNACAEFEAEMTPSQFSCYCDCLCDMVYDGSKDPNIEGLVKLTARQRCEAFLREKGLWE